MQRNFLVCTSFAWHAGTVDEVDEVSSTNRHGNAKRSEICHVRNEGHNPDV